jgi:hypothetical protein
MTLDVVQNDVEPLDHIMVDDEDRSDFAEVGIFSCRPSVLIGLPSGALQPSSPCESAGGIWQF